MRLNADDRRVASVCDNRNWCVCHLYCMYDNGIPGKLLHQRIIILEKQWISQIDYIEHCTTNVQFFVKDYVITVERRAKNKKKHTWNFSTTGLSLSNRVQFALKKLARATTSIGRQKFANTYIENTQCNCDVQIMNYLPYQFEDGYHPQQMNITMRNIVKS